MMPTCIVVVDTAQTPDLYNKIGVAQARILDVDRNLLGSITEDVIIDFLVSSPLFELLLKLCEEGTEEIIPDPCGTGLRSVSVSGCRLLAGPSLKRVLGILANENWIGAIS